MDNLINRQDVKSGLSQLGAYFGIVVRNHPDDKVAAEMWLRVQEIKMFFENQIDTVEQNRKHEESTSARLSKLEDAIEKGYEKICDKYCKYLVIWDEEEGTALLDAVRIKWHHRKEDEEYERRKGM